MKSILVIEDSIEMQDLITNWIKETLNIKSFGAMTVKDAINLLNKNKFDVIVCDFQLPDGDGNEILSFLRQNKIQTPTILFSAHSDLSTDIVSPVVCIIKDKSFSRLFDFIENFFNLPR